jgi:putative spermidine/putrescine transport system substrate-binding protein
MSEFRITRRAALAGAATLPLLSATARADDQVVIGTWGGDYANLLRDNVEIPLLKPKGITVVQDVGDEDPRFAKLMAQRHLPRGADDVMCMQGVLGHKAAEAGVLEMVDTTKIPNLVHVYPNMLAPGYIPHIYSLQVLIYNPDKIKEPPKTFTDLLDPKYKGKVGLGDGNYLYVMMAAALAATGDASKMDDPATQKLASQLNDNGLRLYPSTDSIGAGIKSGEIDVGVMWLARVIMWQNAGIPVAASFPTEGSVLYVSGMVIPKNAPNKAGAYAYINAMLDPSAQTKFAERMGYLPTVNDDPLTGKIGEQLALPTPAPKMFVPDYAAVATKQSDIAEWWKKNIQHA